jgi:hypothetical protein
MFCRTFVVQGFENLDALVPAFSRVIVLILILIF